MDFFCRTIPDICSFNDLVGSPKFPQKYVEVPADPDPKSVIFDGCRQQKDHSNLIMKRKRVSPMEQIDDFGLNISKDGYDPINQLFGKLKFGEIPLDQNIITRILQTPGLETISNLTVAKGLPHLPQNFFRKWYSIFLKIIY